MSYFSLKKVFFQVRKLWCCIRSFMWKVFLSIQIAAKRKSNFHKYIYITVFLAKLAWSTIIAVIYMYAILQNKYLQNSNLCIYTNPKSGLNFSEFLVHIFRIILSNLQIQSLTKLEIFRSFINSMIFNLQEIALSTFPIIIKVQWFHLCVTSKYPLLKA